MTDREPIEINDVRFTEQRSYGMSWDRDGTVTMTRSHPMTRRQRFRFAWTQARGCSDRDCDRCRRGLRGRLGRFLTYFRHTHPKRTTP